MIKTIDNFLTEKIDEETSYVSAIADDTSSSIQIAQVENLVNINHAFGITTRATTHITTFLFGGTVSSLDGDDCVLNITTTAGSVSNIQTRKVTKIIVDATFVSSSRVKFASPVEDSFQLFVVGNAERSYSFGYFGTTFGIYKLYGGKQTIVRFRFTTASTSTHTAVVTLNSIPYNVNMITSGGSIPFTAHQVEEGGQLGQTFDGLWLVQHSGNDVFFISQNLDANAGTYSYSSATSAATVSVIRAGVATSIDAVPYEYWNKHDNVIVPTNYNYYRISWSNGVIRFYLGNERSSGSADTASGTATGDYQLVYTLTDTVSIYAYSQHIIASIGSTTAMSMATKGTSIDYINGNTQNTVPIISSVVTEKTLTSGPIVTVGVTQTLNGFISQGEVSPLELSVAVDGTKSVTINLVLNATVGALTTADYDSFVFLNSTESVIVYDTNASTYTGGTVVASYVLSKNQSAVFDISPLRLFLSPFDTLTIASDSDSSSIVNVSLILKEV